MAKEFFLEGYQVAEDGVEDFFLEGLQFNENELGALISDVTEEIELSEIIVVIKRSFTVDETLNFNESIDVSTVDRVNETVTFNEVIDVNTTSIINESFTFSEVSDKSISVDKSVVESLDLIEDIARLLISNKINDESFTFNEIITHKRILAPISVAELLSFSEIIIGFASKPVIESLTFNEATTYQRIHVVTAIDDLIFDEIISRSNSYVRNATEELIFQGGSYKPSGFGGEIFIPEVQYVKIDKKCAVVLESTTNNTVIVLPCPIFGDTEKNLNTTVIKRSMNNRLYAYSRKNDLQQLNYTFIMGKGKARQLQTFVEANVAKTIVLLNWKGERWYMKMTSNPFEFTPQSRFENEAEKYEVSLEFKGVRVL